MARISTGAYMKASQLSEDGDRFIIASCDQELIPSQTGAGELKWVLHLEGDAKPLILNSTNINRLVSICGSDETDLWCGQEVILFNDPSISYAGAVTGGCRVKPVPAPPKRGGSKRAKAKPPEDLSDIPF
jgi:hypothetical protein